MKTILLLLLTTLLSLGSEWNTDFEKAKLEAKQSNKLVLLYFSGSDWCTYCMQTKKEFLENDEFEKLAANDLILVNADFPRKKKNKLDRSIADRNMALRDKYNPRGVLPLILIFDADGKELKRWEGVPEGDVESFVKEIKQVEMQVK